MVTVIVLLILAGVSLNAIIGENGIITNALDAKILQAIATLQEEVQVKTLDLNEAVDDISIGLFSYTEYPSYGFLRRVAYGSGDVYVFDYKYIDKVDKSIKNSLVGGDGVNGSMMLLKNVYGINEDFSVWYIDENGKIYGNKGITVIPINPMEEVKISEEFKSGMGVEGSLTVGDVRGRSSLTIDGSKMVSNKIENLDELTLFPNLIELTLKNLNLKNIDGLEYSPRLQKIWFDNTLSEDYNGLKFMINVTGFYPINNSVTEENIVKITNQFDNMTSLKVVRIRDCETMMMIPELNTLGAVSELWIEENDNLTNIYGLSKVKDKTHLKKLYLNENNLTDYIETTDKDPTYEYILPKITTGSIINLSYIDGYENLEYLNCSDISLNRAYGTVYENGVSDERERYNRNLHYLVGIKENGEKLGLVNLKKLQEINLEYCDILDIEQLKRFMDGDSISIKKLYLLGNLNIRGEQIANINELLDIVEKSIDGKYVAFLNNNKETLDFASAGLTDLSFLDGNTITTSLSLRNNTVLNEEDMKFVGEMKQLTQLNLRECTSVNDFSFLYGLSNLEILDLAQTKITNNDIEKLSCKESLKVLSLYGCNKITGPSYLTKFENTLVELLYNEDDVYYIDMREWNMNEQSDLSILNEFNYNYIMMNRGNLLTMQGAISNCTEKSQRGLCLSGNVALLNQLENCTEITSLVMKVPNDTDSYGNFSGDTSLNLSKCDKLDALYLNRMSIENLVIDGCEDLAALTIIDMNLGTKWKVSDFSKNGKLNHLELRKNYLEQEDLKKIVEYMVPEYESSGNLLKGTPLIEEINLSENNFNSLQPFSELSGKTNDGLTLNMANNHLITLTGIEDLTQLTELNIENNNGIANIQPILDLKSKEKSKLKTVDIKGCTQITEEMKTNMRNVGITVSD